MRKLLTVLAVTAAVVVPCALPAASSASNGGPMSQFCEFFFNPVAGNFVVQEFTFGQFNKGVPFPSKTYTTDHPPTSCVNEGILPTP